VEGYTLENTSCSYVHIEDMASYKYVYFIYLEMVPVPLYAVLFIFGTIGNDILIIIITHNKDMRNVPNMYIHNLAISDMIHLVAEFSMTCANRIHDRKSYCYFICKLLPFCRRLSVGLSSYFVAVRSIQRYIETANSFHVRVFSQPTWRVNMATICGCWLWLHYSPFLQLS
jgi:hypothetical protein